MRGKQSVYIYIYIYKKKDLAILPSTRHIHTSIYFHSVLIKQIKNKKSLRTEREIFIYMDFF